MSSQKPIKPYVYMYIGFPGGSLVRNSPASAGNASSIHESGSSLAEGNGNPLQHPCLGNPMDRGTYQATVHVVAQSQTPQLSD